MQGLVIPVAKPYYRCASAALICTCAFFPLPCRTAIPGANRGQMQCRLPQACSCLSLTRGPSTACHGSRLSYVCGPAATPGGRACRAAPQTSTRAARRRAATILLKPLHSDLFVAGTARRSSLTSGLTPRRCGRSRQQTCPSGGQRALVNTLVLLGLCQAHLWL